MDESEVEEAKEPVPAYCRHCGQPNDVTNAIDWACSSCERYQDSMHCPTCKQPARISLMPPDLAPKPHAPVRRQN